MAKQAPGRIFREGLKEFLDHQFDLAMFEVTRNLSGRMMHRRTGRTLQNVESQSKVLRTGFRLATTKPSLIAWMLGSTRKAYRVEPKRASVLAWTNLSGETFFSKGHIIPAWRFQPVRPVLDDALERRKKSLTKDLGEFITRSLNEVFPNERVRAG